MHIDHSNLPIPLTSGTAATGAGKTISRVMQAIYVKARGKASATASASISRGE
jgi:hypothetical protein